MSNLIDVYKKVLAVAKLEADDDGLISTNVEGAKYPYLIGTKRGVLPTQAQLEKSDKNGIVIFHPLRESASRDESEILQKFRNTLNILINITAAEAVKSLLILATSKADQTRLSPHQQRFLSEAKDADEGALKRWTQLQSAMKNGPTDRRIVNVFLRRKVTAQANKTYGRGAVVFFPIYEELMKAPKVLWGVTLTAKDRATFCGLLKFIFDKIDLPNAYNYGSDNQIAPFLDALLHAVDKLFEQMFGVAQEYSEFFETPQLFNYDANWKTDFENLPALLPLINSIPVQAGNEGSIPGVDNTAQGTMNSIATSIAQNTAIKPVVAPAISVPQAAPAPAVQAQHGQQTQVQHTAAGGVIPVVKDQTISFADKVPMMQMQPMMGMPGVMPMMMPGMPMVPGMMPGTMQMQQQMLQTPQAARAMTSGMGLLATLPPAMPNGMMGMPGMMPGMPMPGMMPMPGVPPMMPGMMPMMMPGMGAMPQLLPPNDPRITQAINMQQAHTLHPQQQIQLPNGQVVYVQQYLSQFNQMAPARI